MPEANVEQKLLWFSKHEGSDTVTLEVQTVVTVNDETISDTCRNVYGSDKDLCAHAGSGRWNEDDICELYGLTRGVS